MGKKGGAKRLPNSTSRSHTQISLREEATRKLQTKAGSNIKSILKREHLKNLAVWASNEASIPSLAAFYGQRLASIEEGMGIPPDPDLITCERCEIVLQPGFNCTVRIVKKRGKSRHRRKKIVNDSQNNVVYECHFCWHQNLKRGTRKGHMKGICSSKEKSSLESKPRKTMTLESVRLEKGIIISKDEANMTDEFASRGVVTDVPVIDKPATPPARSVTGMSEGKKRKRNRLASNKAMEPANMSAKLDVEKTTSTSSKRRRKSWTSLKEIAQSSEHNSCIGNLSIPFFL